ncbi:DUF1697 domain-containing protein [Christiangramia fulva]|nr:DUF1697 domain-containing protein [Christiangramia fulva]
MKYAAILRGVNVGGHKKIGMKDLRRFMEEAGFKSVQTYIQSGNIIFEDPKSRQDTEISEIIEKLIKEHFNFEVPVIVWNAKELRQAVDENPYTRDYSVERLYLTFLKTEPGNEALEEIENYDFPPDLYMVSGKKVFIYCSGKYSDSKLTNKFFENKLKVPATTRNWKTVQELCEMAN